MSGFRLGRSVAAPIVGIVVFGLAWELLVRVLDIRRFVLLAPSRGSRRTSTSLLDFVRRLLLGHVGSGKIPRLQVARRFCARTFHPAIIAAR